MSVVLRDVETVLGAAVSDVADARLQLQLALERRDGIIVQAVDEGMRQTRVAELAQVSPPHVVKILARSQPGDVLPR